MLSVCLVLLFGMCTAHRPPAVKLHRRSAVFVAAPSILLAPCFASAEDDGKLLVVEPTGGQYSTIAAAVAAAPVGAKVLIKSGTYIEQVKIKQSVTLEAEPGTVLSWFSDKPYEAALTIDLGQSAVAADVLVSGLTIRHASPSIAQNYAVFVPQQSREANPSSLVALRDCDVSSSSGSGVGVEGGAVTLDHCRVHDCKNHGVSFLGRTARGAIRRCSIESNKLNGVLLRDSAAPILEANKLNGNQLYGAAFIDCRGRYLEGNVAKGNGKGAVSGECDEDDED